MITVVISGPQGSGKSKIAFVVRQGLKYLGINSADVEIYTTNTVLAVPNGAQKEE